MPSNLRLHKAGDKKFHLSAHNYEWNQERTSNSSQSTRPVGGVCRTSAFERLTQGSCITYYSLTFFIAYAFKGHVHVFAGRVKVVSHSSCWTSAIFKYFCPLQRHIVSHKQQVNNWLVYPNRVWCSPEWYTMGLKVIFFQYFSRQI